jgi:hypothetical protein
MKNYNPSNNQMIIMGAQEDIHSLETTEKIE